MTDKLRDDLAHEYYNRENKPCDDDEVAFIKGWDACTNTQKYESEATNSLGHEKIVMLENENAILRRALLACNQCGPGNETEDSEWIKVYKTSVQALTTAQQIHANDQKNKASGE